MAMLLLFHDQVTEEARNLVQAHVLRITGASSPHPVEIEGRYVLPLEASRIDREADLFLTSLEAVECIIPVKTPYKLVSRLFKEKTSTVIVGDDVVTRAVAFGGEQPPRIIAGPCAVENREQLFTIALAMNVAGADVLRGGAFKPRTSPYQFQGLGVEGLALLAEARKVAGLPVVTEVMEPDMVEIVAQHVDMLQIGARNMQNYPLLQACGRQKLPVMLKRALSATIEEWLLAAEYIVAAGNPNVVLCERGIRSYDPHTRNVLDLTSVPLLHELTHLPVIVDPSHATGKRTLVPTMARASIAAGADGIMVETHCNPDEAFCDGKQAISSQDVRDLVQYARAITALSYEERKNATHDHSVVRPHSIVR
jgi:3-deoxy-7-phosphoheptulonate synthase